MQFTKKVILNNKNFFIDIISLYFPFSVSFIRDLKNRHSLSSYLLAKNKNIKWDEINSFEDSYFYKYRDSVENENILINYFKYFKPIEFDIEMFKNIEDEKYWSAISENENIFFSESLIDRYIEKWDWSVLSANKKLPFSESFINRFKDKWDWNKLSNNSALPLSEMFIKKYVDNWNWNQLSQNENFPITPRILKIFKNKINWTLLPLCGNYLSYEIIEEYEDKWFWDYFYAFGNFPLIYLEFNSKFSLFNISKNQNLQFSESEIKDFYSNNISFIKGLSENKKINWTYSLIDKYIDEWDWVKLSNNESLPWSESFIRKYKKKFLWVTINEENEGLSKNYSVFKTLFNGISEKQLKKLIKFDFYCKKPFKNYQFNKLFTDTKEGLEYPSYSYDNEEYGDNSYNNIYNDPNYNPDLDLDQQSQNLDFF